MSEWCAAWAAYHHLRADDFVTGVDGSAPQFELGVEGPLADVAGEAAMIRRFARNNLDTVLLRGMQDVGWVYVDTDCIEDIGVKQLQTEEV